jgi:uncharacterized membrane protein
MSEAQLELARRDWQVPKWVVFALVGSLAVNVLTLSVIATSLWEWGPASANWHGRFPMQLAEFSQTLPGDKASTIKRIVQEAEPVIKSARSGVRQARHDLAALFRADPFDKEQFMAVQNRLLEEEAKGRRAQLRLIADVSDKMSIEERRAFIRWRREHSASDGRRSSTRDQAESGTAPR